MSCRTILVIGGMSFVGSHFVRLLVNRFICDRIIVIDDIETDRLNDIRHSILFEKTLNVNEIFNRYNISIVINFTDIAVQKVDRCLQVLPYYIEQSSSDIQIRYSNCYGIDQDESDFVPKMILSAMKEDFLILANDGLTVHDWLHVDDCCHAIELTLDHGNCLRYDICSGYKIKDIDIAKEILREFDLPFSFIDCAENSIILLTEENFDATNLKLLRWSPSIDFYDGLSATIKWYKRQFSSQK